MRISILISILSFALAAAATPVDPARRNFLRCGIGLTTGLVVNSQVALAVDQLNRSKYQKRKGLLNTRYSRTIFEQNLLHLGAGLLQHFYPDRVDAALTRSDVERHLREDPAFFITRVNLASPLLQELGFRYFAAIFFSTDWTTGLASAGAFALAHNVRENGVDLETIPIAQFAAGVFYWYLARQKGIDHAILAHGAHNLAELVKDSLLLRYP